MTPDTPNSGLVATRETTEGELDARQFVMLLLSGRWWILFITLGFSLLGIAYVVLAAPGFESDGLVQVEQNDKGLASATHDIESLLSGESTEAEAEMQIIQSRLVLLKVIEKLKIDILVNPKVFPVFGGAIYRARARLEEPADPFLGFSSYAWGGDHLEVSQFDVGVLLLEKKFKVLIEKSGYDLFDEDDNKILSGTVGILAKASTVDGDVQILVESIKARPGTEFYLVRKSTESILKVLSKKFVVAEQGKKSGVIGLKLEGPSPSYVTSVMKEIEDVYVRQNIERRSEEAGQSLDYLEGQLPLVKAQVDAAQAKMDAYQEKKGSVDVTKESELILQQAVDIESQRVTLNQAREMNLAHVTPSHPTILAIDSQLAELGVEAEKIKKKTLVLPQTQQDVLEMQRDIDVDSGLYTSLQTIIQQLQVSKAGTVGDVRVVDYPLRPIKKKTPNTPLVLALSFFGGFFAGCMLVYMRRVFVRGVELPEVVERALGLPTYASIPFVTAQRDIEKSIQKKPDGQHHILAMLDGKNAAIESLRSLRSSLHFAMLESRNNVVMFTGPSPGLGKSFVSINLGVLLASAGKRIVVVDSDLRRGHLHRYVGMDASPGISNFVAGDASLEQVIRETPLKDLYFVSAGSTPPNPSELLLHEKFAELVKELEERFDLVLIDTAPVLPVADAMIVGRVAGCTLIVLKSGEHPLRMIEETVRRLVRAGIQPKGVIFNQVGERIGSYGYGGYGYYYASEYESTSNNI